MLNGHDLRRDIMQQLGQPVWMANDADCFTLSEAVDGAGAGATTVFGVIIGTGCGGGIAVHQQLLSGPNAIAGEWGIIRCRAILLSAMARRSPATAAKQTASKAFSPAPASPAAMGNRRVRKPLSPRRKTAIRAHWPTGDTLSMPLPAAASVINILDPQVIVLGGGLSNVSQIYRDLPAAIVPWIFSDSCRTQIKPARFGDASGVRGAAWLPRLASAADGRR